MQDEIAAVADRPRCAIKLIVTRGGGVRGYAPDPAADATRVVASFDWPAYPARNAAEGVRIGIAQTRLAINPQLAGLKHLNRLEQVLGARERHRQGWEEALMLDTRDRLIGGTMSILFLVQGNRLLTPGLRGSGVRGVMRERVLAAAPALGLQAVEGAVSVDDLEQADELYLSNALIGIWPVAAWAERNWLPGPVTRRLMDQVT